MPTRCNRSQPQVNACIEPYVIGNLPVAYHSKKSFVFLFLDDFLALLRAPFLGTIDARNVDCNPDLAYILSLQFRPHIQVSPAKARDKCLHRGVITQDQTAFCAEAGGMLALQIGMISL